MQKERSNLFAIGRYEDESFLLKESNKIKRDKGRNNLHKPTPGGVLSTVTWPVFRSLCTVGARSLSPKQPLGRFRPDTCLSFICLWENDGLTHTVPW